MSEAGKADPDYPAVLRPWIRGEALTTAQAAKRQGTSESTIRRTCEREHIGRKLGMRGHWMVSAVAFQMLVDDNREALAAYLAGDRTSDLVVSYYRREGLAIALADALSGDRRAA